MRRQGPMFRALAIAAFLAGLALSEQAFAAGARNKFLAHVVGHLYWRGESFACFTREYDAKHLAANPRQRVIFVKALVDAFRQPSAAGGYVKDFMYQVRLAFRFRDRDDTLTGGAECGDGDLAQKDSLRGGAVCAGPGDGPSHLALVGKNVLVMRFRGGADLWAPGPIDQRHDTVKNPFGPDDAVFRLFRSSLKRCEDLAFDRQKPLRPHER